MARISPLFDAWGVIYDAVESLPDELKIGFLEALAELEDHECHRTRRFPKTPKLSSMPGRFRPMALTAAAVIVGSSVILFDPIFQGLAIALMVDEVASLLSRVTAPGIYELVPDDDLPRTLGVKSYDTAALSL